MPAAADDRDREFADGIGGADNPVIRALERFPLPIWMTDRHGQVRWTNVAARGLFGPVSGVHFSRLIAAERVNDARELFSRKIVGAVETTIQNTILAAVAGQVAAELISLPLRSDGGVVGVIVVARADGAADREGGGLGRISRRVSTKCSSCFRRACRRQRSPRGSGLRRRRRATTSECF